MHEGEPADSDRPTDRSWGGRGRPLKVTYEFVVVDGEEAKLFAARQSRAILDVLQWLAEHPLESDSEESR